MTKSIGQIHFEAQELQLQGPRSTYDFTRLHAQEKTAYEAGALAVQKHTMEQLESAGVPGMGMLLGAMRGGKTLEEALAERGTITRVRLSPRDLPGVYDNKPVEDVRGIMDRALIGLHEKRACKSLHLEESLEVVPPCLDPDKMHGAADQQGGSDGPCAAVNPTCKHASRESIYPWLCTDCGAKAA